MRTLAFISLVTLAVNIFPRQGHSQDASATFFVFTNGSGSITPLQNGQLLQVGQSYEMTAIPNTGYVFDSWQPITVFIDTTVFTNGDGSVDSITNIISSPQPQYFSQPALDFVMQSPVTIISNSLMTISVASGWQANFVPVFSLQINTETNNQCTMTLIGPSELTYTIETTTDLTSGNWIDIGTVLATNGLCTFTDTNATNNCQFYRAVVQ